MAIRGAEVDFGRGDGLTVPHVLAADTQGGTVLVVGSKPFVLSGSGGKSGQQVNVYAGDGTNTFKGVSDGTVSSGGQKIYWDNTNKKFVGSGVHPHFGWSLPDQGATSDGDEVEIQHAPDGTTGT